MWTTEQTKQENERTIVSASEIARTEREYRQSQLERQYADEVGIVVRRYKDQGFVRVQVANTGSKSLYDPRMETDAGGGKLTYIRLALVHECKNARFAMPYDWWRNNPYLIFRDGQNRWWKLREAKPAKDGPGVGEPARNATLYTGPLPRKTTRFETDSNGDRIVYPYRTETQIPCS